MRRFFLFSFLVLLISSTVSLPIRAQESKCDPAKVIAAANAIKSTGDNAKDATALQKLVASARGEIANCSGLHFAGKADKVSVAEIPTGLYLVWFRGQYTFSGDVIEGDCGQDKTSTNIFIIPFPDNNFDAKVLKVGTGCQATIKAGFGRGDWSIDFEPLAQ